MKQCSSEGCDNPIFSNDYCKWHQHMRTDKKWLKTILKQHKKGNTKIKSKSEKRIDQDLIYKLAKAERKKELIAESEYRCIFCTLPFYDTVTPDWHHLKGRDGDLFIDKRYLYPAHTKCHIEDYHQATVKHMKMMFWYEGFLNRLKDIDIDLWNKEKRKEDRS